jgi:6,7-dimethyl-8-ribityllumazine synthase
VTQVWEGKPNGEGLRFGVIVSRFNSTITDKLLEGALAALRRARVEEEDVLVLRVPGAFEIPLAGKTLARTGKVAAVVCVGAIIKGGTPHWRYLSETVTEQIGLAALETGIPFTNAVLTTESLEHAVERSGKGSENKGYDAALAAVEMADLCRRLAE